VGVNQTRHADLPALRLAEAEAQHVHDLLAAGGSPLLGPHATHAAVAQALPTMSWAHFACHATANQEDPVESHLALYDRALTVRELSGMDLPNAYLAYLSACTTATGSIRLLDEAIHVAAAFQLAGYPHTIATLWPISDLLAPDIATRIYQAITDGASPAAAVHEAVRAVRDAYPTEPQLWASHIHLGP
jgi:CHAT domain-containing protein